MKLFKRLVIMAIILCLTVCCLSACSKKEAATEGTGDTKEKLVMATNAAFPPYEYVENNEFAGIDVELAEKLAEKLGMELEIKDVDFDTIVAGVESGKFDIGVAGMTVTEDRLKSVNFTDSYAKGIQSVIVAEDSEYASYEDFYTGFDADGNPTGVKEGIKIGVQQGTTGAIYSESEPAEWGFGKDNVSPYKTGSEAVQALKAGKVTAVIIDNEPAKAFVEATEGLKILETEYVEEDYAICVSKENEQLLADLNKAISELKADGTLDSIINKYIPVEE